jgi:hypothetical protein
MLPLPGVSHVHTADHIAAHDHIAQAERQACLVPKAVVPSRSPAVTGGRGEAPIRKEKGSASQPSIPTVYRWHLSEHSLSLTGAPTDPAGSRTETIFIWSRPKQNHRDRGTFFSP